MYLPLTVPFSNTGEHHGIINKLTKTYGVDLLAEKYVELSSSPRFTGEINTLVNHGTGHYQSKSDGSSTYIQISFLKGYIFPTGYTLKGPTGSDYAFSKSWYVYGIHEDDEKNEEKWELLGENDTTQSTYCQKLYGGDCKDDRVGSFSLKQMKTSLGYKFLRWKTKEGCSHGEAFITSGIDVYGTLSLNKIKAKRKSFCGCRNSQSYLFIIVLFGNFISS